jgi:outer membrane biosynthesis protein TonB
MNNKINIPGLIGTIIFHGIIVLILLLFGYITPLPIPQEQGILIAFGNTETGEGNSKASLTKEIKNVPTKAVSPQKTVSASGPSNEEKILTQDHEDAPAIKSPKKKVVKKKVKKPTAKEIKRKREKKTKRKKARIEKERIRKEKAEQKRIKDKRIAEEKARQAKISNINSKAKLSFGRKTGDKSGNSGNSTGKGNMGKPHGSLDGDYNGTGIGNSGVSYSLNGRTATKIIKPTTSFQKSGKVVVTIFVNKNGKVTRAVAGARGTTTHDIVLHKLAEEAALKTSFNLSKNAAATQKGSMTYIFIVK